MNKMTSYEGIGYVAATFKVKDDAVTYLKSKDLIIEYFRVSFNDAYRRLELLMNRSKTHRLVGVKSI